MTKATQAVLATVLAGLAHGADIDEVAVELARLHPKHDSFPGEVLLALSVDALDLAGFSRENPLNYESLWSRLLPEVVVRGRVGHQKSEFVLMCPPALRGGLNPDLLTELYWWTADDYWQFAFYAFVIYARAAAERTNTNVYEVCQRLGELHDSDVGLTWPPSH